mmetsp:Transcript_100762/g.184554  ORF Transcript_100762/g.184554 Transcript_100762/m.184554 type:complete len:203 (+) Transcript_100762:595-1203(+)
MPFWRSHRSLWTMRKRCWHVQTWSCSGIYVHALSKMALWLQKSPWTSGILSSGPCYGLYSPNACLGMPGLCCGIISSRNGRSHSYSVLLLWLFSAACALHCSLCPQADPTSSKPSCAALRWCLSHFFWTSFTPCASAKLHRRPAALQACGRCSLWTAFIQSCCQSLTLCSISLWRTVLVLVHRPLLHGRLPLKTRRRMLTWR